MRNGTGESLRSKLENFHADVNLARFPFTFINNQLKMLATINSLRDGVTISGFRAENAEFKLEVFGGTLSGLSDKFIKILIGNNSESSLN